MNDTIKNLLQGASGGGEGVYFFSRKNEEYAARLFRKKGLFADGVGNRVAFGNLVITKRADRAI